MRTKSDSDRDFRWLKLFFSSRDLYWSWIDATISHPRWKWITKINVLGINFCDSETHLGENAQMVDGEGCTNSLLRTSSFWLASCLLPGFAQWSLRVCARNHCNEFSPDVWTRAWISVIVRTVNRHSAITITFGSHFCVFVKIPPKCIDDVPQRTPWASEKNRRLHSDREGSLSGSGVLFPSENDADSTVDLLPPPKG